MGKLEEELAAVKDELESLKFSYQRLQGKAYVCQRDQQTLALELQEAKDELSALRTENGYLRTAVAENERAGRESRLNAERLAAALGKAERDGHAKEEMLQDVLRSHSWRLTAPLRHLMERRKRPQPAANVQ